MARSDDGNIAVTKLFDNFDAGCVPACMLARARLRACVRACMRECARARAWVSVRHGMCRCRRRRTLVSCGPMPDGVRHMWPVPDGIE